MIDLPCVFRPDLLPDGKPRHLWRADRLGDLVAGERGLLVCTDEAQLADLVAFLNEGVPDDDLVTATVVRKVDRP